MNNFENSEKSLRQNAETKLAASQEIFSLLINAVEDYAIFALDTEGNILTWNAGGERLKGYRAQEVIGSNFSRFYIKEDRDRRHPQAELEIAKKSGKYEEEGWRVKKDGSLFWANVVITALFDQKGVLCGFGKVTRDLSERKKAELALKESEERFRLMVEGVEDYAIFMLDTEGKVATWNRGAERNKGYFADEIIGKHFSKFYPESDLEAGKPQHELKEAALRGRFEDEGWRVRKDGSFFWANVIITAVYNPKKELVGFSKITRDLTERKKSEDELKTAFNELERRVQQRTVELSMAKAKAEKAVAARDQFFSMASHELRTPLSSLKLQVQLRKRKVLKGNHADFAPENLVELCESDERQINRLSFLVDNMLDISKLTSEAFDLALENLDLAELVRNLVKGMEASLDQTGNTCRMNLPATLEGRWDRHRLEQVLTNLLSNAGKYAPGKPVDITLKSDGENAILIVKDYGKGIPQKNLEKIFNPFERLNTAEASGLGLGLYIVQQIITAHKGKIAVETEQGSGTSFTITLPMKSEIKGGMA